MGTGEEVHVEAPPAPAEDVTADVVPDVEKKNEKDLELNQKEEDEERDPALGEERSQWSSRTAFILAAIGSAVGLGNFWRYPYLMYKHGGGAFLIPYWFSLFVLGIPMLLLELSLGQKHQSGDVASFGSIHPKLRGVGYASVAVAWCLVTYYTVIISWTLVYFVESFSQPWIGEDIVCYNDAVVARSEWHFYHEILHYWNAQCESVGQGVGDSSEIAWKVVLGLCGTWVLVAVSVLYGVKSASYVVWVTMPLPFVLSIMLFFRAITLEGASDGIDAYIGTWEFDKLREPEIWTDAVGQIFFSIGVCLGVMTSYGSYRPRTAPVITNVFIVSLTNCIFSFFCGFIVFGVLGYMAHEGTQGCLAREECALLPPELSAVCQEDCHQSVDDVVASGFALVFVAFPTAFETMGDAGYFFSLVTFLTLFLLGWDSAFSLVEAITTVLLDAPMSGTTVRRVMTDRFGEKLGVPIVTVAVCTISLCIGLLFCADIGLIWLDLFDHYTGSYTMLIDGTLQCIAVGWVWGVPKMRSKVGTPSTWWFTVSSGVAGALLIALTVSIAVDVSPCETNIVVDNVEIVDWVGENRVVEREGTTKEEETCYVGGELGIGAVVAMVVLVGGWAKSFSLSGLTVGEWFDAVFLAGSLELWSFISKVGHTEGVALGEGSNMIDFFGAFFKYWWCLMIKFVSPIALTFLVLVSFKTETRDTYEGYATWSTNLMWYGVVLLSLLVFAVFIILPGEFGTQIHPDPDPVKLYKQEQLQANAAANGETSPREPIAEDV